MNLSTVDDVASFIACSHCICYSSLGITLFHIPFSLVSLPNLSTVLIFVRGLCRSSLPVKLDAPSGIGKSYNSKTGCQQIDQPSGNTLQSLLALQFPSRRLDESDQKYSSQSDTNRRSSIITISFRPTLTT